MELFIKITKLSIIIKAHFVSVSEFDYFKINSVLLPSVPKHEKVLLDGLECDDCILAGPPDE